MWCAALLQVPTVSGGLEAGAEEVAQSRESSRSGLHQLPQTSADLHALSSLLASLGRRISPAAMVARAARRRRPTRRTSETRRSGARGPFKRMKCRSTCFYFAISSRARARARAGVRLGLGGGSGSGYTLHSTLQTAIRDMQCRCLRSHRRVEGPLQTRLLVRH